MVKIILDLQALSSLKIEEKEDKSQKFFHKTYKTVFEIAKICKITHRVSNFITISTQ